MAEAKETNEPVQEEKRYNEDAEKALKLSLYMTLKNLHDKWLRSYNLKRFKVLSPFEERQETKSKFNLENGETTEKMSEFSNFIYVDSFYCDIGDKMLINPETLYNIIKDHKDAKEDYTKSNMSVYQAMARTCEANKLMFITLPIFNNYGRPDTIANMFRPYTGLTMTVRDTSTYIVMYTHEISHVLNNASYDDRFRQDGFDIADVTGKISPEATTLFNKENTEEGHNDGTEKYDIIVPAFGVTYARQNQSIFKNITVNMESPKLTDFSIMNQFRLARMTSAGGTSERTSQTRSIAQDAYSVFANQSYTCTVEMLGCMNIMPMMYFQLNNTPMFRGAYMIVSVKHDIVAGSMTTKFTGIRVSKIRRPFVRDAFSLAPFMDTFIDNMGEYEKALAEAIILTVNRAREGRYDEATMSGNIWTPPDMTKWKIPESSSIQSVKSVFSENTIWEKGKTYKVGQEKEIGFSEFAVLCWLSEGFNEPYGQSITFDVLYNSKMIRSLSNVGFYMIGVTYKDEKDLYRDNILGKGDIVVAQMYDNANNNRNRTLTWYTMYNGQKLVADNFHGATPSDNYTAYDLKVYRFNNEKFKNSPLYQRIYKAASNDNAPKYSEILYKDGKLSNYFTFEQLTVTNKKIKNIPNEEQQKHLSELCANILDPLQSDVQNRFGRIIITSAFRSQAVNAAVGGVANSAHLRGYAADIKPSKGTPKELYEFMKGWLSNRNFDQLIFENKGNTWVHIGYKSNDGGYRRSIFVSS